MSTGGGGGGGQTTNTVTRTELDPIMRPFVQYGLQESTRLYQNPDIPQYYPGQTYVGPSQQTQAALAAAQQRAVTGNPLVPAAQQAAQQTIQGGFLGGNPFFEGAFRGATQGAQTAYQDATQAALSNASRAGRYGSGSMGTALDRAGGVFANALTNTAGQLAYQNYGTERGLQESAIGRLAGLSQQDLSNRLTGAQALSQTGQQTFANQAAAAQAIGAASESDYARRLSAAQLAPGLAAADYSDINQLLQTGQAAEGYQEAAMADAVNRFNFAQQAPYMKLQSYLSGAYGAPSGMQQVTPVYRNQMGNVLGGALTGAALGGGTGLGAGVGAAIGGGLGLLG